MVSIHNHIANVRFLKTHGHGAVDTGCEHDIIARFSRKRKDTILPDIVVLALVMFKGNIIRQLVVIFPF